jgi:hypothetical protein
MESSEIEQLLDDLETRMERLRALYEQYFLGIEKLEPQTPRKDVDRRIVVVRREQVRNTALRFRFTTLLQRYNTLQQYWARTTREIENGTYRRDVRRAAQRFGEKEALTILGKRKADMYAALATAQAKRTRQDGEIDLDDADLIDDADPVDDAEPVEEAELIQAVDAGDLDDDDQKTPPFGTITVELGGATSNRYGTGGLRDGAELRRSGARIGGRISPPTEAVANENQGAKSRVAALAAQVKPQATADTESRRPSVLTSTTPREAFGEPVWAEPASEVLDLDLDDDG